MTNERAIPSVAAATITVLETIEQLDPFHISSTACATLECHPDAVPNSNSGGPEGSGGQGPSAGGDFPTVTGVVEVSGRIESNNLDKCGAKRCGD